MSKGSRVLIADDNRQFAQAVGARLASAGYEVFLAGDAYNALVGTVRERPHVLLLDIHMPAGEGFSVPERLSKMTHVQPPAVIYLTGDRGEQTRQQADACGPHTLLYKPMAPEDVLDAVNAAMEQNKVCVDVEIER